MKRLPPHAEVALREYVRAINKAERLLSEAEHGVWMIDQVEDLYGISKSLRDALQKVSEGMYQVLALQDKLPND